MCPAVPGTRGPGTAAASTVLSMRRQGVVGGQPRVTPAPYGDGMFSILKVLLILLKHAGDIPTNEQLRKAGLEPMRIEPRMPYPSPLVFRQRHRRHR